MQDILQDFIKNSHTGFLIFNGDFSKILGLNHVALTTLGLAMPAQQPADQALIASPIIQQQIHQKLNVEHAILPNLAQLENELIKYLIRNNQSRIDVVVRKMLLESEPLFVVEVSSIKPVVDKRKQLLVNLNSAVKSFLQHSNDIICVIDEQYKLVVFNAVFSDWFKQIMGRSPIKDESMLAIDFTADGKEKWKSYFDETLNGHHLEIKHAVAGRHYQFTLSPFADATDVTIGAVVFGKDVTETHISQLALQDSERRFRALADSIPGVVFIVEKESEYGVIYLSENIEQVTGYHPDEFYQQQVRLGDFIHPGDIDWIMQYQEESYRKGMPYHIEYRMKNREGDFSWIEEYGTVLTRNDGKKYLQGVFFNITQRKQSEIELKQSERNFRLILDNTSEIIFSLDTNNQFTFTSLAIQKFTGYLPAEIVGQDFLPFIHEADQEEVKNAIALLKDSKTPKQALTYRMKHKNGDFKWYLGAFNPVLSRGGRVLYVIGASKDITENIEAEAAIKEQNKQLKSLNEEKDNLLSVVAHDLKSPFDKTRGLSQLIAMAGELNEEQKNYIQLIEQITQNGVSLISSLLDLSKLEQDQTKLSVREEDIGRLIKYAVESHDERAKKKKITLTLDIPEHHIGAFVDASLVGRCIDNLLSNAIKFSTAFTTVTIKLIQHEDSSISIHVIDQGPGISQDDQKKMFRKFQKLTAVPTGGESSSGLGLAIVKALVDKMGGDIAVQSEINQGTTFIINLPYQIQIVKA